MLCAQHVTSRPPHARAVKLIGTPILHAINDNQLCTLRRASNKALRHHRNIYDISTVPRGSRRSKELSYPTARDSVFRASRRPLSNTPHQPHSPQKPGRPGRIVARMARTAVNDWFRLSIGGSRLITAAFPCDGQHLSTSRRLHGGVARTRATTFSSSLCTLVMRAPHPLQVGTAG